jgi:hypothetical protein
VINIFKKNEFYEKYASFFKRLFLLKEKVQFQFQLNDLLLICTFSMIENLLTIVFQLIRLDNYFLRRKVRQLDSWQLAVGQLSCLRLLFSFFVVVPRLESDRFSRVAATRPVRHEDKVN